MLLFAPYGVDTGRSATRDGPDHRLGDVVDEDRPEREAAVEKEVTKRLQRKLEGELTSHLQKLGAIFGGRGLKCSGSDAGDDSDEPSPVSAGEEDAREEAPPELPVPAGPARALAHESSSSDSSDSEEK